MARQIQFRRGTTAQHAAFTGAVGEVTVDTDKDVVVVHDGSTAGGFPMMKPADLTAGTGISIAGTTITNSAPDQTVSLTGGTSISISGTYPNFTVTNDAPDQTVALTAGTGISTSGTYPNFTITNSAPDQTVSLTASTGISVSGTYPSFTITNSAPDQTVSLTAGTSISISGTYPNFTINSTGMAATNPVITAGTITEDVYTITGTSASLEPDNGSVQLHTLTGNTTYTDGFSAGQAITLMIDDGTAYTVTWPTMTWVNNAGAAPTLATTGYTVVAIWKVSTTLYGALVGDGT